MEIENQKKVTKREQKKQNLFVFAIKMKMTASK